MWLEDGLGVIVETRNLADGGILVLPAMSEGYTRNDGLWDGEGCCASTGEEPR